MACMNTCIHVYIQTYIHVCIEMMSVNEHIHTCICIHTCRSYKAQLEVLEMTCVDTFTRVHITYIHTCVYTQMQLTMRLKWNLWTHTYIHIHIHTYIHVQIVQCSRGARYETCQHIHTYTHTYMHTFRLYNAQEALEMKLVNTVVPLDQLEVCYMHSYMYVTCMHTYMHTYIHLSTQLCLWTNWRYVICIHICT